MDDHRRTIELVRRGSREAAGVLFDRCWPVAWRAAYTVIGDRSLAEDAAQEAVAAVFRGLRRFDATRPLEPWVRKIAVNTAIDLLRREGRARRPEWVAEHGSDAGEDTGVGEAVAELPEDKRLVVVLHYWLDYTVAQIAEALDLPIGTVAARLSRARLDLRSRLEANNVRPA
jgi:RNA polymerase sigma-70 factor (ECF subfamily)